MPRTNEKDAYYFPHDCNARNDPKVLALRSVFGAEGYGVYFMTIEILREQPDYRLKVTKYLYNALAMQMQVQADKVQEIIEACCNEFTDGEGSSLLVNDGEYLYSASLLRRMDRVDNVSEARRAAARKRWENEPCKVSEEKGVADGESNSYANGEQKQSKEKKTKADQSKPEQSKGNQTKQDPLADFAAGDVELLAALRGFAEMRRKIKKPMTDRALQLMLAKLQGLSRDRDTQIAILNQSVERSWAGIFPVEDGRPSPQAGGRGGGRGVGSTDKMDVLRDLHEGFSGGA